MSKSRLPRNNQDIQSHEDPREYTCAFALVRRFRASMSVQLTSLAGQVNCPATGPQGPQLGPSWAYRPSFKSVENQLKWPTVCLTLLTRIPHFSR